MTLFKREPHLRFTPRAGPPVDFDLTTLDLVTVADVLHEPVVSLKEMVDYSMRRVFHGWRVTVRIVIEVTDGSPTDAILATIWQHLGVDELEVSMDDGVLYRDAVMGPGGWTSDRMSEKNVGRVHELTFIMKKLLTEDVVDPETRTAPPAMGSW